MRVAQHGLLGHIILKTSDMTLKQAYAQAMEWLYMACIALSGTALVVITLIIPYGVFMRYVMNNPQSWPEPASVVMMVFFSFGLNKCFDLLFRFTGYCECKKLGSFFLVESFANLRYA